MKPIALLLLAAAVPSLAGPVRLKGGPKSEDALRKFVEGDAKLKARIEDAIKREEAFVKEARESDLRDAVSDAAIGNPTTAAGVSGDRRKMMIEALPGMKAPTAGATLCADIADCSPELSVEVADARGIPDAMRRMIRPWMALQQARGGALDVRTAEGEGDAALILDLKGPWPLTLNVSPHLVGGFKLWIDHPEDAAALWQRERAKVAPAR